jgi:23S rRNA pseudouridine2605 synthase
MEARASSPVRDRVRVGSPAHAGGGARATRARRIGLARALSKLGCCSRSQAAVLIREGLVRLNGRVRRDPETPVHLDLDKIKIGESQVAAREFVYLVLNKPGGVVTTASDEKGRETVYAYLDKDLPWVAPVGRLDKASEGLLLLTNDSEWAGRILAPESHIEKTYHVQIAATNPQEVARTLAGGVESNGELLRVKRAAVLRQGQRNAWLEITLREGRNRHIRRMLAASGVEVLRLLRVSIGPLALGALAKGAARSLSVAEKRALDVALATAISRH